MSKVRAKFKCQSVTDYGDCKSVELSAVHGNEGENVDFSKYTPSGKVEMRIDNETAAADYFIPGKEYYLDFIES